MATNRHRKYYKENISAVRNKKLKERLEVDPWSGDLTIDELRSLRRTLAKQANQRLVRLERAHSKITGESYADYGAAQLAKSYLGDRRRYSEQLNYGDTNDVKRDIYNLQTFLASPSSTVKGQQEIEAQRVETFKSGNWGRGEKKRSGIADASNGEFYDFLNSDTFHKLSQIFTSDILLEMYEESRENKSFDEVVESFESAYDAFKDEEVSADLKNLSSFLGVSPLR